MDVRAEGAVLDEVLERLADTTGMELDWPRPRPRPRVTVRIEGQPLERAIPRLLEGLRFNYAMLLGTNGHVRKLVVLDAAPPGSAPPDPRARENYLDQRGRRGTLPSPSAESGETPPD